MASPPVIKKLDEVVINRIAAGEVIQHPANALKEMIENSLDAKSSDITVTIRCGGLKFMQIQDNGTGIRKEDLEIVCERFTTSKLQQFEDLTNISTYGFRGEALASISHVAHLTILTKTFWDKCAYKASYIDSKLKEKPKPCAGNQGTQITVEDLFYNMPTRRKALRSPSEEYQRIADVVGKYAIHNAKVGFKLKKCGEKNDIRTNVHSTHIDNIRSIYGNSIAKELLEIKDKDDELKFEMNGLITNVNYSTKKTIFLLFINHRLVDSTAIRKAIELVYGTYLPKNSHPFVYLSIEINPKNVDVNVHPTKHEVHFLYEEQIIDKIKQTTEKVLLGSNASRVFYTQALLPGASKTDDSSNKKVDKQNKMDTEVVQDKNLVRTDSTEQKLDKFFQIFKEPVKTTKKQSPNLKTKKQRVEVKLHSINQLREAIEDNSNSVLRTLFAQHSFVGIVDQYQALLQHNTELYLCQTERLTEELFYQFLIFNFQNFDTIKLNPPLAIYDLAMIGLTLPNIEYDEERFGPVEELAELMKCLLIERSDMLNTYFAMEIDAEGNLISIPLLLDNYVPDMCNLPIYLTKIALDVEWETEKECFETFSRETAIFYAKIAENNKEWAIEHVLFPAIKQYLLPPKQFAQNGYILQVASLPNLYKVFERC